MKMKLMVKIWTFLALTIVGIDSAFATAQAPDVLYYNEDTLALFANPLESYYTEVTRPKNFFGSRTGCMSTSCWRGYIAYWMIEGDTLYLIDLKSCCYYEDSIKADLYLLFGERYKNGKVKADWLTGEILSPQGKLIFSENQAYSSIYETELGLTFNQGHLTGAKIYDNSKSKRSEYETNTIKLKDLIYSNIDWKKLPLNENEEVKVLATIQVDSFGQIKSVVIGKSTNTNYNDEISRVIKEIPEWSVYYRHGEFVPMSWTIPVFIDKKVRKEYDK